MSEPIRALAFVRMEWDPHNGCFMPLRGTEGTVYAVGYDKKTLDKIQREAEDLIELAYPDECDPWEDDDA